MRRAFKLIAAGVITCALAGCEKPVPKLYKTSDRSPARAVGGFVVDSARNDSIARVAKATIDTGKGTAAIEVLDLTEVPDLREDSATDPLQLITGTIDTTITLGAWLRAHSADRVSTVAVVGSSIDDTFCRAAVVKTRVGKQPFVRSALFYIPASPKGEQLPTDTADVAENCQLRTVALVSQPGDYGTTRRLLDSLTLMLDTRLAPHSQGDAITGGGIPGTDGGMLWRHGATSVVAATAAASKRANVSESEAINVSNGQPTRLFVVAYAPGSGAEDFNSWEARYESLHGLSADDRQLLYRNVDSAVVWADLPTVAADLKTVIGYLRARDEESQVRRPASIDVALLRALKAIHEAAPALSLPRRAAALLAGDIALNAASMIPGADSNHAIMRALPSLGLSFPEDPGGYGPQNPRAWLWEAYRIDSTGRAGRAAFIELLGMQWPDDKSCAGNEYKRVIEHGEAALARGDDNPLIHYYVGSAYKTIYDLAHYENDEVGNPAAYKSQAEPARLKAIEHFRAALQSLPDRATRREAWMKAMRLILHRSGEQPEYVCFPD